MSLFTHYAPSILVPFPLFAPHISSFNMSSACEAGFVLGGLDATYFPAAVPVSLTSTTPRFSSHSSLIRSFPHFPVAFIPRQPLKTCPSGTCTTETGAALAEEGDRAKLWRRGQKNEGLVLI